MTITTTALRALSAGLVAALAMPAGAAYADGPGLSVGTGCAAQCIKKAAVTVTSTTAKVVIETTVPAHLTVYVTKRTSSPTTGGLAAPTAHIVSLSAFAPSHTARFINLLPDTRYDIVVKAVDLKKQVNKQRGAFKTLKVKVNAPTGPTGLDSGLGCGAQCIDRALFKQVKPVWWNANVDIGTDTDARVQVIVSRDKPTETAQGPAQYDVVSNQLSAGYGRSWQTQIGGLQAAKTYYAVVRAKDRQGRIAIRSGSFRTVPARAIVTIHKLKIVNDGDKGGKGELHFKYEAGGQKASSGSFQKIKSGKVVDAKKWGSSRPGVTFNVPLGNSGKVDVSVLAEECDGVIFKNCVLEAFAGPTGQYAYAAGTLDVWKVIGGGALPPWYGTGVGAPAGFDGYFVLATGSAPYVEFIALGTLDIEIDWP